MSWSMNAQGTAAGIKSQLASQKVYGATPDSPEQKVFDKVRDFLVEMVEAHGYKTNVDNCLTIFKVGASGHAEQVTSLSLSYELAFVG